VSLDDEGCVAAEKRVSSIPAVAAAVAELAGDEPFLLGVNTPVVVPAKPSRGRPVENLIRRQFRHRLPPGGRSSLQSEPLGVAGEALMAGLAAAGLPALPYPDRDRRRNGLAETYPALILKALLWDSSCFASLPDASRSEELLRAFAAPPYRKADLPARAGWTDQAVTLELLLRALDGIDGFDLSPAREQLTGARTPEEIEYAAALLDASLIAGTARRYLESPEQSVFVGDREGGYAILPADGLIRRLAIGETKPTLGRLFPEASLAERLRAHGRVHSPDLLNLPGKPRKIEVSFDDHPFYEFDNLDEMMWWKHCRHVSGPHMPTEGLLEMRVVLRAEPGAAADTTSLGLVRSRHRTLSFRFDPPRAWRASVPTRDGKTYRFEVQRAVYETLPARD
jgi:predicted RNase H-like nuclease